MGAGANGDAGSLAGPSHVRTGELQLWHRESPTICPFPFSGPATPEIPHTHVHICGTRGLLLNHVRVSRHMRAAFHILKVCRNGSFFSVTSSREEYAACDIGTRYVRLRVRAQVDNIKGAKGDKRSSNAHFAGDVMCYFEQFPLILYC